MLDLDRHELVTGSRWSATLTALAVVIGIEEALEDRRRGALPDLAEDLVRADTLYGGQRVVVVVIVGGGRPVDAPRPCEAAEPIDRRRGPAEGRQRGSTW